MVVNLIMKHKREKSIFIVIITTIVVIAICIFFYNIKYNFTSIMNKNIENASEKGQFLYLSNVTPFEWDKAFVLEDPYIGGDAIDKIVGVKCNVKRIDVDFIRRIVFVKDNKFIYDFLYNYTDISFTPLGIIIDKDDCKFRIEKSNSDRLLLKFSK
jgi:hypothetical protein